MSSRKKYLVDTSLVCAVMKDTGRRYSTYVASETADGTVSTSTYIRMEFIRVWICSLIRLALYVDAYGNLDDALNRVEQDFGPRKVKANLSAVRTYLKSRPADDSPQTAAKEIARLAVHWLRRFDRVLKARIQNRSHCQIGGRQLDVDFRSPLTDLQQFYAEFKKPVIDCGVNDFLDLPDSRGRTSKLLTSAPIAKHRVLEKLAQYQEKQSVITCTQCQRIGDAVIALEQPKSYTLVSSDSAFDDLCQATGRPCKILRSLVDVEKESVPSI